jgi:hypothetical protein
MIDRLAQGIIGAARSTQAEVGDLDVVGRIAIAIRVGGPLQALDYVGVGATPNVLQTVA